MNTSKLFTSLSLSLSLGRKLKFKSKNSRAFTLIELLVVITILGILSGIIFVSTNGAREAARDTRRQSDLSQIRKSLQAYYLVTAAYPSTGSSGISLEADSDANATFTQAMKGSGYMSIIPRDPKYTTSTGDYAYKYISTTTNAYALCAKSEAKTGYICTDQTSNGISQTSTAPMFGDWGAGEGDEGGAFVCGVSTVTFTYKGSSVTYGTVEHNSKCWMDRNLGATKVATSFNDCTSYPSNCAYGDLFQWGRLDDGHQTRTSGITTVLSGSSNPGHGNFIYGMGSPYDWVSPQIETLWQGVSGTNNPCPSGWRIPTEAEWTAERVSWTAGNNYTGAFASPLKLTAAGYRYRSNAVVYDAGANGYYWSSAVSVPYARLLYFHSGDANMDSNYRANGFSVRCVKD
ncbi:MAG: FISUMP domain-containing protein [Candidatus Paceibacterota bacterium]